EGFQQTNSGANFKFLRATIHVMELQRCRMGETTSTTPKRFLVIVDPRSNFRTSSCFVSDWHSPVSMQSIGGPFGIRSLSQRRSLTDFMTNTNLVREVGFEPTTSR